MPRLLTRLSAAAMLLCAGLAAPAMAQVGTAFTYQGKLEVSGVARDGTADFQFRLFASPTGTTQIGQTQALSNVQLDDGTFTAPIDFGAGIFDGQPRYLEIAVRSPAGSGAFVTLNPRQPITPTPYAIRVPGIDGHSLDAEDGSPTNAVFVNNDGNVGVGTVTPLSKLDVRSGNGSYFRIDNLHGDIHANGGTDGVFGIYNDTIAPTARTDFIVNGQARMVINAGGGVGINTLDPVRRLDVVEPGIFAARFTGLHPIGTVIEIHNPSSGSIWEAGVAGVQAPRGIITGGMYFFRQGEQDVTMVMAPNQWVGLGVNNPGFRLDLPNISNPDGRGRANRWDTYSSIRWKDNVRTVENALDKVMQLRGVRFDWKPQHGGAADIGFVAEEVGKVVPELVSWEDDGENAKGLAYDHITALTVEAIKEQQRQIEDLKRQLAELMSRLEATRTPATAAAK